jgi:Ser/Thr protein kinase RdoA (MazF antagonist)
LAEYDLTLLARPEMPPGGGRSHSVVLRTDQGKKVLKRYKHTVSVPTIIQEHAILAHLAGGDFPSPRLVTTPAGKTLVSQHGHNHALFDFIEGGFQYTDYLLLRMQVRQFIRAAGKILATLHSKLEGFSPEGHNPDGFRSHTQGRWRDVDWYASRLTRCRRETQQLGGRATGNGAAWLLQYADYLEQALSQLDVRLKKAHLPRLIIHGDYGPYNLRFWPDGSFVVLDFEIARLDWRATEVADALWRFCHNRFGFNLDKMKWFVKAYRAEFAIAPDELELLPEVWILLNVQRSIVRWHRYCNTHDTQRLAQARWFVKLIDWMQGNRDAFLAHVR